MGPMLVALRLIDGEQGLTYSNLRAYDARVTSRELPSQMRATETQVILEVNDDGAKYPVTIDPSFTQEVRLSASNGFAARR